MRGRATIIAVFANRPLVGYRAVVVAIIAVAFLSFGWPEPAPATAG
jgi:heme/copper-type cytochrome/quinol oxidase subunit 1